MHEMTIEAQHIDAIFLDLDGVVTSTARVHAAAWKATFDAFLEARDGQAFEPFDEVQDYALYVDGRLRQDGVRTFLASRGISLPLGRAEDAPSFQTVWGLGNRKNGLFRELLSSRGVDVYDDARDFIKRLRSVGIICGLVSASRNCRLIVSKSGLAPLFDIIIDGNDAERLGLRGKPAPDMFLAAAKGMGIKPDRACVIEDAPAGIEAANAGGFRLAILVSRKGGEPDSRAGCATVRSLAEIDVEGLPSASESLDEIAARIQDKPHAVLLDYDGTLTPIVARPELAVLSERMRGVLSSLAEQCPTGIVTGRSLAEIRRLVGVDLSFIASHGMEQQIKGCAAEEHAPPGVAAKISQAADALQQKLGCIGGVIVERKPFSVAVHYRLVGEEDVPMVLSEAALQTKTHPSLRMLAGKKVVELRPDTDWNKGKAVLALADRLGVPHEGIVYVGDDVTDEDAFEAIRGRGIGVAVMGEPRHTAAAYILRGEDAVGEFLEGLLLRLQRNENF